MNRLAIAAIIGLWTILACPTSAADIGGSVPSPGGCDYPATGTFGMDFGVYHYSCAFPTEINGSHHQCTYGGAAAEATGGVSFMFINASITLPVGVLEGVCYWACPDQTTADQPNPPGAWKDFLVPKKCKTTSPAPVTFWGPPEPPADDPPPDPAHMIMPPPSTLLAPVTDPVRGNPDATVNPHR